MIIRSGLIENRPGVDPHAFARHWRDIHGPLALAVPNLRGYAQNLVVRRGANDGSLHSVDGISQLWFDDVAAMERGTASPEQQACIEDIRLFLDHVTLAIQQPGAWHEFASPVEDEHKLMAIHAGAGDVADLISNVQDIAPINGVSRWRFNPVTTHGVVLDANVARSTVGVTGILEAWFAREVDRNAAVDGTLYAAAGWPAPAMVLGVQETILMQPN